MTRKIRCIDCDELMPEEEWEKHQEGDPHYLNVKVNLVIHKMKSVDLSLKELNRTMKKRLRTKSTAGSITKAIGLGQMGAMRAG